MTIICQLCFPTGQQQNLTYVSPFHFSNHQPSCWIMSKMTSKVNNTDISAGLGQQIEEDWANSSQAPYQMTNSRKICIFFTRLTLHNSFLDPLTLEEPPFHEFTIRQMTVCLEHNSCIFMQISHSVVTFEVVDFLWNRTVDQQFCSRENQLLQIILAYLTDGRHGHERQEEVQAEIWQQETRRQTNVEEENWE